MTDQPSSFFWEQRTYTSADGRVVIERIPHDDRGRLDHAPDGFSRFIGMGMVQLRAASGAVAAQKQFEFDIDADSPGEAMTKFNDAYSARAPIELQDLQRQYNQARADQGKKIVIPNGKLLNRI